MLSPCKSLPVFLSAILALSLSVQAREATTPASDSKVEDSPYEQLQLLARAMQLKYGHFRHNHHELQCALSVVIIAIAMLISISAKPAAASSMSSLAPSP